MIQKVIASILLLVIYSNSFGQDDSVLNYLKSNATVIELDNVNFEFDKRFYENDIFFFGFVHGSETPQILDLELLKELNKNGVRYYAPEVDYSLAFFFNEYLKTGDESMLDFACEQYVIRVPQDASIQFKNKWKSLYRYNKSIPEDEKIIILGLDREFSKEVTLTHIAYMAPTSPTGISIVDSLQYFKNLNFEEVVIISGKPAFKSGKGLDYFLGGEKTEFFNRFKNAYRKDSVSILHVFGDKSCDLKHLMSSPKIRYREQIIYDHFEKMGLPLVTAKEKIYFNYGYFHIQQKPINGSMPIAGLLKQNQELGVVSILGMLTESECLKNRKVKFTHPIYIKGTKFRGAEYNGYSTSKSYDGDSFFEKVNGIGQLKKVSGDNDITLFNLDENNSPLFDRMLFADFTRGGKNWKVEKDAVTNDYFQHIILIKNSTFNIPLEEENDSKTKSRLH